MSNLLDGIISLAFPGWGLRRTVARQRMAVMDKVRDRQVNVGQLRSVFDAVAGGRMRYDVPNTGLGPNVAIANDIATLRGMVRALEYTNGNVAGAISRIANNVVGLGIRPQSRVEVVASDAGYAALTQKRVDVFNQDIEALWRAWAEGECDQRMVKTFYELEHAAQMALERDGEALLIGRESKRFGRLIPYCLAMVEVDRLVTPIEEMTNPKVQQGVILDDEGAPKSYLVLKYHPGETPITAISGADFEEVPAFNQDGTRKVLHLAYTIRPEQIRGFSRLAAALANLQDLDRYTEAEIYGALEAACLTGVVKTPNANQWNANTTEPTASGAAGYERLHDFAPGKWVYTQPGEEVTIFSPNRPNTAFGETVNQLLRGPANSLDVPPEILTQDWRGMNYSNARTVLLAFYLSCRVRQAYLARHLCAPVWQNFVTSCVANDKVKAWAFDQRRREYCNADWIAPGWQWVDPVKEAQGKQIEIDANMETLSDVCAAKGLDVDEVLERRAKELKKMQELETKYGITFPANNKPAPFGGEGKEEATDGKAGGKGKKPRQGADDE